MIWLQRDRIPILPVSHLPTPLLVFCNMIFVICSIGEEAHLERTERIRARATTKCHVSPWN